MEEEVLVLVWVWFWSVLVVLVEEPSLRPAAPLERSRELNLDSILCACVCVCMRVQGHAPAQMRRPRFHPVRAGRQRQDEALRPKLSAVGQRPPYLQVRAAHHSEQDDGAKMEALLAA